MEELPAFGPVSPSSEVLQSGQFKGSPAALPSPRGGMIGVMEGGMIPPNLGTFQGFSKEKLGETTLEEEILTVLSKAESMGSGDTFCLSSPPYLILQETERQPGGTSI